MIKKPPTPANGRSRGTKGYFDSLGLISVISFNSYLRAIQVDKSAIGISSSTTKNLAPSWKWLLKGYRLKKFKLPSLKRMM
jgi:hypothetical protein